MSALIDLTGQRFGMLTVIKRVPGKYTTWLCRCDCGKKVEIISGNLRGGISKSCGCKRGPARYPDKDYPFKKTYPAKKTTDWRQRSGRAGRRCPKNRVDYEKETPRIAAEDFPELCKNYPADTDVTIKNIIAYAKMRTFEFDRGSPLRLKQGRLGIHGLRTYIKYRFLNLKKRLCNK